MSKLDRVSFYFSALAAARGVVSNLDTGAAEYSIVKNNGERRDATKELRNIHMHIIEILEEVTYNKERRKSPRRPSAE